jgi:hypothetical protein
MDDIGDLYGVTRAGVQYAMDKCQIGRRTKSEARILALDKRKFEIFPENFNKHYFDELDIYSAGSLGVVYACGTIIRDERLQLTIAQETMWVMRRLATLMEMEHIDWKENDWEMQKVVILASVEMCDKLREYGFPKKKRRGFGLPNISGDLIRPFVCGYMQRRGLVSYSKTFMLAVANWLLKQGASEVKVAGDKEFAIYQTPEIISIIEKSPE